MIPSRYSRTIPNNVDFRAEYQRLVVDRMADTDHMQPNIRGFRNLIHRNLYAEHENKFEINL